jgi:hypothetical protein
VDSVDSVDCVDHVLSMMMSVAPDNPAATLAGRYRPPAFTQPTTFARCSMPGRSIVFWL